MDISGGSESPSRSRWRRGAILVCEQKKKGIYYYLILNFEFFGYIITIRNAYIQFKINRAETSRVDKYDVN